ncbi:conserved exported hypothetical protein [uncultured Pleomorphomonas sp.]|uniref:Uncharacterized protein n=1 Tax=uncultured Pleomorphomonas sp. TaxID=442121 RepID=A0A212LGB2_9HYPH|nr:tripartite tricarboxylate transporter substrate binding protein [uncultured Pleomorphomonas sp.]SCM76520.1 conserved exported hypothetical protein [uncultured Pleomorphomonas sp.]
MKTIGLVMSAILALGVTGAVAQQITYPTKNISVIIPKNPGGGTDTSTRLTLEYAKQYLPSGIIFVPENKPAGNGVTGLIELAHAKPDGMTLGTTTVELAMFPHQNKSPVTYADFTPLVAQIADPCAVVVRADSPYKTLKELIDAAKADPGKIQVANSGTGAIYDLATSNIEKKFDVKFKHIPFNEGTGPSIAALVGGHVDAVITTPGSAKSQVDAGALKILGVMDDHRFALYPDVPTFAEALGADAGVAMRAWAAIAAPANLDAAAKEQLVAAFKAVLANPDYQEAMKKQGIVPGTLVGDDVANMMQADHELYKELIAAAK